MVFGIAGYLLLRSQTFHGYVLAKIQQQASEATGATVRIKNFSLHLSKLGAEAYGITIRGGEPKSSAAVGRSRSAHDSSKDCFPVT